MKERMLDNDKIGRGLKIQLEKAEDDIQNENYKVYSSVDDLFEEMNKKRKWWEPTYYVLYRFFDDWIKPSTWKYRIHRLYLWFFVYGFNPKDIWGLDYTLSKWIIPRITRLKETKHGVPTIINGDEDLLKSYEKEYGKLELDKSIDDAEFKFNEILWNYAMDKMIHAFELTIKNESCCLDDYKTTQEQINEGLKYFAKYFNCLWD